MLEEPKVFEIDWKRDYDALSLDFVPRGGMLLDFHGLWVMLDRTTQFHSSVAVPVGLWELETLGM